MKKISFLLLLCIVSCASDAKKRAPNFTLMTIDGYIFNLSEHLGKKVIIIDFWATWCPPCRAEIPGFVRLYEKYKEQGLLIVGISLDMGENALEIVRNFSKEYNINYPVMMGDRETVNKFGGIRAIPTTFIINRKGEIVEKIVGYRDESFFENKIKSLL
ncbi:MAG: TlpA disulfide reductase family protein [Candidatus Hydrothermales bacterium]